jgi:hypothetical protein
MKNILLFAVGVALVSVLIDRTLPILILLLEAIIAALLFGSGVLLTCGEIHRNSSISRFSDALGLEGFDLRSYATLSLGQQGDIVHKRLVELARCLRRKEILHPIQNLEPEYHDRVVAKTEFETAYKVFLEAGYISDRGYGAYFEEANKLLEKEANVANPHEQVDGLEQMNQHHHGSAW